MALGALAGLIAGALISALTVLAEHSRIEVNSYALYGNGALIIPAILSPYALYPGWTWILHRGGQALEMALFVVGLHFGVGLIGIFEVMFFTTGAERSVVDALPAFVFSGAIFVLPTALLGGLAYFAAMRVARTAAAIMVIASVLAAAFLSVFFGAGLGILAGGAVAATRRMRLPFAAVAVALLIVIVVFGNLPYMSALITPQPR